MSAYIYIYKEVVVWFALSGTFRVKVYHLLAYVYPYFLDKLRPALPKRLMNRILLKDGAIYPGQTWLSSCRAMRTGKSTCAVNHHVYTYIYMYIYIYIYNHLQYKWMQMGSLFWSSILYMDGYKWAIASIANRPITRETRAYFFGSLSHAFSWCISQLLMFDSQGSLKACCKSKETKAQHSVHIMNRLRMPLQHCRIPTLHFSYHVSHMSQCFVIIKIEEMNP